MSRFLNALPKALINQITKNNLASFSRSNCGEFFQKEPTLGNQYDEDTFMKEQLLLDIPQEILPKIEADLRQFGSQVSKGLYQLHLEAERNPPRLEQFDAWGNRVDNLIVTNAWNEMKKVSAKEGLISIPYENQFSIYSRLYQILKLYLFAPSSGLYACPLAMTDGAAKTIETVGIQSFTEEAFYRLTSRDPSKFWTSGQWMTERKGGSDVAEGTETIAIPQSGSDRLYKLYGYKWFSSATDADIAITLARICDHDNKPSEKLSMFFAKVKNDNDGSLNGIEIQKLKNKLGTRQLPTAELLLDGMVAYRMSEVDKGISSMSSMLNITRLHNSLHAISNMRRTINFARDYATKRIAFGKRLIDHDLHSLTLGNMEVECRASFLNLVCVSKLLGKSECSEATSDEQELLRFLTPLIKLYTAKQVPESSIAVASEGLEAFGGQGYIEDTGFPNLLRDAQVLSIWEGTTNILSLDVLRSIKKSKGESLKVFQKFVNLICEKAAQNDQLKEKSDLVINQLNLVCDLVSPKYADVVANGAREFAFSLYRLFTASLILERCMKTNMKESDIILLNRWCVQRNLTPILTYNNNGIYSKDMLKANKNFVLAGHPSFGL